MPRLAPLASFADDAPLLELGTPSETDLFDGPAQADVYELKSAGFAGRVIAWRVRGNVVSLCELSTGVGAGSDLRCAELNLRFGGGRLVPSLCFCEDAAGLHLLAATQTVGPPTPRDADGAAATGPIDGSGEIAIHRISFPPPPTSAGDASGQAVSSWLDLSRASPSRAAATRRGARVPCVQCACALTRDAVALGLADELIVVASADWHTGLLAPLFNIGEGGGFGRGVARLLGSLLGGGGGGGGGTSEGEAGGQPWWVRGALPPAAGVVQLVAVEAARRQMPSELPPFAFALCAVSVERKLRLVAYPSGALLLALDLTTISHSLSHELGGGTLAPGPIKLRAVGNGELAGCFGLALSLGRASSARSEDPAQARVLLLAAPSSLPWTAPLTHCLLLELAGAADVLDAAAVFAPSGARGEFATGVSEWEGAGGRSLQSSAPGDGDDPMGGGEGGVGGAIGVAVVSLWRGVPGVGAVGGGARAHAVSARVRVPRLVEGTGDCRRTEARLVAIESDGAAADDDGWPLGGGEGGEEAWEEAAVDGAVRDAGAAAECALLELLTTSSRGEGEPSEALREARVMLETVRRRCLDPSRFTAAHQESAAFKLGGPSAASCSPASPPAYARRGAVERGAAARAALCAAV
ncbi:hypothetical protein T492DRAFT_1147400, partial [Pavlovales sp. CCMP2436]